MVNKYLNKKDNLDNHLKINQNNYYRTNDIIKKLNNHFFVMGRSDSVVKLRGYRIELKGVESKIREFKNVSNTYVFLHKQKIVSAVETKERNEELFKKKIKYFLSQNLPNYMVPHDFIIYSRFPINKSYKVNRYLIKKKYI